MEEVSRQTQSQIEHNKWSKEHTVNREIYQANKLESHTKCEQNLQINKNRYVKTISQGKQSHKESGLSFCVRLHITFFKSHESLMFISPKTHLTML